MTPFVWIGAVVVVLGAAMAFVRWAPVDGLRWHADLSLGDMKGAGASYCTTPDPGARFGFVISDPVAVLQDLDRIALATARTTRLAGSAGDGRISWVTRSALMGFPDITTAQILPTPAGPRLCLLGRQRYGSNDFGVNGARIDGWVMMLEGRNVAPEPNPL